jgi:outer membrane protein OmpA-like peptidoglycan-associated protein
MITGLRVQGPSIRAALRAAAGCGLAAWLAGCSSAPVAKAGPAPEPVPVADAITACGLACGWESSDSLRVTLFDDKTRFDFGSDTITPDGMARLQHLASILSRFPDSTLRVDGYSDSRGTETAKLDISKRRAEHVAEVLREMGVSATRFESVEGRSDTDPLVSNASNAGRPTNRRVELHIHHLRVH